MKICCGTDIIEIERIKRSIENQKTGKRFLERVYTKKEMQYCESKKSQKYQHYAVRFAAKEATFKALSEQIEDKYTITWKDIEIIKDTQGKPKLNLANIDLKDMESIDLSLSHDKQHAIATVVVLRK